MGPHLYDSNSLITCLQKTIHLVKKHNGVNSKKNIYIYIYALQYILRANVGNAVDFCL